MSALDRCGRLICNRTRFEFEQADAPCALDGCPFQQASTHDDRDNRPFLRWPDNGPSEQFASNAPMGAASYRPPDPAEADRVRILTAKMHAELKDDLRMRAAFPLLLEALQAITEEVCDYARINNLGDPEQKHNVKLARAAIAKATSP